MASGLRMDRSGFKCSWARHVNRIVSASLHPEVYILGTGELLGDLSNRILGKSLRWASFPSGG